MKTILLILSLLVCSLFAVGGSSYPAAIGASGITEWGIEKTPLLATADTNLSTTDSTALLSMYSFKPGWQYIFVHGASAGTAADSVKQILRIDYYDMNKTLLYSKNLDTLADSKGSSYLLPVGLTVFAPYVSLVYKGYTANGGQVIFPANYGYIAKVRVASLSKTWQ